MHELLQRVSRPDQNDAIAHARTMVARYEQALVDHPPAGAPLTRRQQAEADNLEHWRRRLANITTNPTT